jgi:hypothetical protein
MKAYQLISAISPDLQKEIVSHMFTQHKAAFRMVQGQLAQARKLRPVFLQQKTREEQYTWMLEQLRVKPHDTIAEQVIQLWLLKGQQPLLTCFLDAVGIVHKDGEVEDLPEEITEEQAKAGVDALLKDHSAEKAALYLTMFQKQKEGGWPSITAAMQARPELQLETK